MGQRCYAAMDAADAAAGGGADAAAGGGRINAGTRSVHIQDRVGDQGTNKE